MREWTGKPVFVNFGGSRGDREKVESEYHGMKAANFRQLPTSAGKATRHVWGDGEFLLTPVRPRERSNLRGGHWFNAVHTYRGVG